MTADQTVDHARQQRIPCTYRAGHRDLGRQRVQRHTRAEPVNAFGTLRNHHVFDTLRMQARSRLSLRGDGNDRRVERVGQFLGIGLDQPRPGSKTGTQGQAAAVQRHLQTQALEHQQKLLQPLGRDAARQAARHHHHVETGGDLFHAGEQRLLRRFADLRPRTVEVGNAATAFGHLDVAAGFPWHTHKLVDKVATLEQRLERLLIVDAEKTGNSQLVAQVSQHLRHVEALAGCVSEHCIAAVDLAQFQLPQL
ncbi:pilus assembly protein PilM [Pseudomonas syringae pv. spinaceae]|uniref:Pilus assembly protein PilM n=1 Tax=Pseudomonas syringae pv. spinaceae TaxID=264459 RepID=A0A0Q0G401_PSESX|nr:pilus assembly protein PilM [Pseudomonas syringae pv. spinaceae]